MTRTILITVACISSLVFSSIAYVSDNNVNTIVKFSIDLNTEKCIQEEVDDGHQPWRLRPVDVAYAALHSVGVDVQYNSCRIVYHTGDASEVKCESTKSYKVLLKKLLRPDGIWTAVEMEVTSE